MKVRLCAPLLRALLLLGVLGVAPRARADYLEIRRDSLLKKTPERAAETAQRLDAGAFVTLIGPEQRNGYYEVRASEGQRGFVYRTLVRRYLGSTPVSPSSMRTTSSASISNAANSRPKPEKRLDADGLEDLAHARVPTMRAHVIDVGQGAATLFEFSCGAVLIDVGGESNGEFDSESALRGYLEGFFARRLDLGRALDLVVLTHPHLDHVLNARMVTETFVVRNVVTNGMSTGSGSYQQTWLQTWAKEHARLHTVRAGEVRPGGIANAVIDPVHCTDEDPKIQALWGAIDTAPADFTERDFNNANNHSIALRLEFGKASFLFTGDLELPAIALLIDKHRATSALDVDVWQVSHHGSANGVSDPLLRLITPAIAVLSTGALARHAQWTAWQYGHPREIVVDALLAAITRKRPKRTVSVGLGAERFEDITVDEAIYATGWDGSVVVTAKADGTYEVVTER